jgi:hypothetical protein
MQAPDIKLISKNFTFLASLDSYTSLQWYRKLYEVGSIELHIPFGAPGAAKLLQMPIIFLDAQRAGIIQKVIPDESKDGLELVAYGVQLKGLAQRRITVPGQQAETQFYGYDRYPGLEDPDAAAESVIKHYANTHMIAPEDTNRAFPGLVLAADQGRGMTMRWQSRFEQLDTVLQEIGEWSGMGYDIYLDLDAQQYIFEVIPGAERTIDSDTPIIFSPEWGNIDNLRYTLDESNWRNAGYAGGAGEDEERLIQTVYEDDTIVAGFERREAWLDCGSIDIVDDLLYEGKYKLADKKRTESMTGDLIQAGPFKYREHWDLGDIVTLQSKKLGVSMDTRITEIKEAYEQGKQDISVTFGNRTKNIIDEIRKAEVVR